MIRDPESFTLLVDTIDRFVRDTLIPREQEVADTDALADSQAELYDDKTGIQCRTKI